MNLKELLQFRRSVRFYDPEKSIDPNKVQQCVELATLSPNSSNMQLWEFYHVTDPEILKKLAHACLDQEAATTAKQMVVFVTRQDLHRKRAKRMIELETQNVLKIVLKKNTKNVSKDGKCITERLFLFCTLSFLEF